MYFLFGNFTKLTINQKMILSKTPLRISFAGGGTDIKDYYLHNNYYPLEQ